MKKFLTYAFTGFLLISCCGCNKYFVSTTPKDTYYGAYNRRDFTHADVVVFQRNSDKVCNGSIYLNAPSRGITFKNDRVNAKMKLGCSDGRILDINWQLRKGSYSDGTGIGADQLNNKYEFKTVNKKEYRNIAEEKHHKDIKFPNDKNKSYLLY